MIDDDDCPRATGTAPSTAIATAIAAGSDARACGRRDMSWCEYRGKAGGSSFRYRRPPTPNPTHPAPRIGTTCRSVARATSPRSRSRNERPIE